MQKLHYKVVLRRDQQSKSGTCKILLNCTINGARVRISTGLSVLPADWDPLKQQMRGRGEDRQKHINTYLANIRRKVDEIFFHHLNSDTLLTVEKFEREFSRKAPSGDFLVFMLNEIAAAKPDQAPSTVRAWMSAYNHLKECFGKIAYGDLNLDLVKRFDSYQRKKGLDINYIAKNHSFLRKYIILLAKSGRKVPNPYQEFKVRSIVKDREFLTDKEVVALYTLYQKKELKPHLQRTLRHFLFQIGTSLRYSDLAAVSRENLIGNQLVFSPIKTSRTGKLVKCPLSEMATAMLADSESESHLLFAVYAEQTMNRWLKEIASYAGIGKKFTTHIARHTYGYLFIAAGGQIEVLQKIMGHSDLKTTQVYTHIANSQIRQGVDRIDALLNLHAEQ
jgi:integrase/recombinase XerD